MTDTRDLFAYESVMGDGPGPLFPTQGPKEAILYAPGFGGTLEELRKAQEDVGPGQVGGRRLKRGRKTRKHKNRRRGILKRRYGRTRGRNVRSVHWPGSTK
jgi:hypothetical protein